MKIGVFDSGRGGLAVAQRLRELLPEAEIVSADDHSHVPYGGRPASEIINLADAALQPLFAARCDAIVLACNTVTTVAITTLRSRYPEQTFIGIEPMVKPAAALTKSNHIAVLATVATLQSRRYRELKETWARNLDVIEPDCSTWATAIETGQENMVPAEAVITQCLAAGADVIVLACSHFHWLKPRIQAAAGPHVTVLEPSDALKERIVSLVG